MAETTASPNNIRVKFKGKPMAKSPKASSGSNAAPSPGGKSDSDWEAEDGLRTLQRAQDHQNNPDMMTRIGKVAKKQSDGLDAIMGKLPQLQKQGLVSDSQAKKIADRRTAARK